MENFHVFFKSRPGVNGTPSEANFGYAPCEAPSPCEDGEIIIRTVYLSVDPAQVDFAHKQLLSFVLQRCQMNEETRAHYLPSWQIGETIEGLGGVGLIVESKHERHWVGELVTSGSLKWPWKLFFKIGREKFGEDRGFCKIFRALVDKRAHLLLSIYGLNGMTALLGILERAHIHKDKMQTFVVSGAAGATGHIAGQIAKVYGCKKVIGICGSEEKCNFLMNELDFDFALNYKKDNVKHWLDKAAPDGVDIYFDNVGGVISNDVISKMNRNSHVILCGQISQYNKDVPYPPPLSDDVQKMIDEQNITRQRFLVLQHQDLFENGIKTLSGMFQTGHIKVKETITEGLENAGAAFVAMMNGGNIGKAVVKCSEDDSTVE